jgi:arsenite methyltransferase
MRVKRLFRWGRINMKKEEVTELEHPYFDIQVQMGVTKHMGGWKATQELAEMCHIEENKYVLIVGCGNGISACKLAKTYGCRIVGIDISEGMVELSRNWAQKEGLTEIVGFRVADAQELPFEDDVFDAVISESVTSFPEDKVKAINEYVRVVKSGGFIGLNEVTWMEEPSPEMEEYAIRAIGGCKPETAQGWKKLLENSGLQDINYKKAVNDMVRDATAIPRQEVFVI